MTDRRPSIEPLESRRLLAVAPGFPMTAGYPERYDWGSAIAADAAGNVYVAGSFRVQIDMDPSPKRTSLLNAVDKEERDIFLAKYTSAGKLLWSRLMWSRGDDEVRDLRIDPGSGDIALIGVFGGVLSFPQASGRTPTVSSHGGGDVFIARLTRDGAFRWAGSVGGGENDGGGRLAFAPNGDLYYAATIRMSGDIDPTAKGIRQITTRGVDDQVIARIDGRNGRLKSFQVFGEGDSLEDVTGLEVVPGGDVVAVGSFMRRVAFDRSDSAFTRRSRSEDSQDVYMARLTPALKYRWLNTVASEGTDKPMAVTLGPGGLYVAGVFEEPADFDPSSKTAILSPVSDRDVFVARYNFNGSLKWARNFGGNDAQIIPTAISVDAAGNVYTVGTFDEWVDFDPSAGVFSLGVDDDDKDLEGDEEDFFRSYFNDRHAPEQPDMFVQKLSASGAFVTAVQLGGRYGSLAATDALVDAAGNLYTTGFFTHKVDFDPAPKSEYYRRTYRGDGDFDWFVNKFAV